MKRIMLNLVALACALSVVGAANYRDFTSKEGKVIRGVIKRYDPVKNAITIEREDRKTFTVSCDVFSDIDQSFINKWKNQEGVRNDSKLEVSCDRRVLEDINDAILGTVSDGYDYQLNQEVGRMAMEAIGYKITLNNRNGYSVNDIVLEYCIYYEQEIKPGPGVKKQTEEGVLFGSMNLDELESRETKTLITDAPIVYSYEKNTNLVGSYKIRGRVVGIAMRFYVMQGDEKIFLREEVTPSSVLNSRSWSPVSVDVGANVKKEEDGEDGN